MKWLTPLIGLVCLTLAAQPLDEHDPDAQLASFQLAEGFEANLFASEADGVVNPIQLRFDHRGRAWVIISTVYPQLEPGQIPNDKVLILEDTNGDGRADRTTVFADGLMIPTGLELTRRGAYVGHGTELLYLEDTDGDDRADVRRAMLRGFGTGDNHQNINSFLWGPGGELWMSQGLHTQSNVETPWGIVRLNQAGLWRLWPKRLKLEGFYGSQFEPQNPWGFVFTHWGEPIVIAGNNSSPIYAAPGLASRTRPAPPPLIWRNGQGRKSSGGDIVGNKHFPENWQGTLILGGYINNAIWALNIVEDGAGFALEDREPLLRSTSRNFRPVDVKFGPDGALYVCDWYNPIIGHYQASFRHPDRDKSHGRIWRITARGRSLTEPPRLEGKSAAELMEFLASEDRFTRYHARRLLADMPSDEVLAALNDWISRPGLSDHALKEALGVCQSHEVIHEPLLERLARSAEPGARAYAAGVVGGWSSRLEDPLRILRPLAVDPVPRVRLQAMVASTYAASANAMEVAAAAASPPMDPFLEYAWGQAVHALKPYWLPALKEGKLDLGGSVARLALLVRADRSADTLEIVRELASKGKGGDREIFQLLLIEVGEAADFSRLLGSSGISDETLGALLDRAERTQTRPPGDLAEVLRPLAGAGGERGGMALRLAGLWSVEEFAPKARELAGSGRAPLEARVHAVHALGYYNDAASRDILTELASNAPPLVQAATIAVIAREHTSPAAGFASRMLEREMEPEIIEEIFTTFLQREGGASALATAFERTPPATEAARIGLRLMSASGRRDDQLARGLERVAGLAQSRHDLSGEEMDRFVREVVSSGNFEHGRQIYQRPEFGCVACHSIHGEGGNLGPDLSALGTAQPIDFIVGAILDPSREVKEGFLSISVTTREGEEFQGYQVRETDQELVLRDALENREIRIPRARVREKRSSGSIMPSGLVDTLTRDELRDLVRYLSELGKPGIK